MTKEIEVLLLGSLAKRTEYEEDRFNQLLKSKLDWAWITGELIRHRINGNFYSSLSYEQRGFLVQKVKQTFDLLCSCYEGCNKINLEFAQELFEDLNKAGITTAGLKGLIFSTCIYPMDARRSNDIDILVDEKDLKVFDEVMRSKGFIQSLDGGRTEASKKEKLIQRMNYHDLVPYFKRIELPYMDAIKVDVNFQFAAKDDGITSDILKDGVQFYEGNGYRIQGLKWQTHILHILVHFYREASNSIWTSRARDVELYKTVDIENTLRTFTDEQLMECVEYIRKYKIEKQCYFSFYYLNQFYPSSRYEMIMKMIEPEDKDFLGKVVIQGGDEENRKVEFFDKTFDMHYGQDFTSKNFNSVD